MKVRFGVTVSSPPPPRSPCRDPGPHQDYSAQADPTQLAARRQAVLHFAGDSLRSPPEGDFCLPHHPGWNTVRRQSPRPRDRSCAFERQHHPERWPTHLSGCVYPSQGGESRWATCRLVAGAARSVPLAVVLLALFSIFKSASFSFSFDLMSQWPSCS